MILTAKKLSREFFDKFTELVDGGTDTSGDFSEKLENLAEQEKGDTMENDNKTEENVYPSTHWTIWVLGLISVAALIAFVMHLKNLDKILKLSLLNRHSQNATSSD